MTIEVFDIVYFELGWGRPQPLMGLVVALFDRREPYVRLEYPTDQGFATLTRSLIAVRRVPTFVRCGDNVRVTDGDHRGIRGVIVEANEHEVIINVPQRGYRVVLRQNVRLV